MLGQAAALLQRHILGVLVIVLRVVLVLAQDGAGQLLHRSGLQDLGPLLLIHKAAGAVGAVRQDVKAALVPDELVAGEPGVAFFGDEADEQRDDCRDDQAEWGKGCNEVFEGIEHPDKVSGDSLSATLRAYICNAQNKSATAAELNISRAALQQRLDKMESVLQNPLNSYHTLMDLYSSLRCLEHS